MRSHAPGPSLACSRVQGNRRIELRTLVIASVASAAAAGITSQFWIRGTPIAAALTPLIITLVSELLHRPTERLAGRIRPETDALAEASAAASPPAATAPATDAAPPAPDVEPAPRRPVDRRRIAWAAVLGTGLLAFAIGATALTVAELVAGGSIGKGDRATSLISGDREARDDSSSDDRPRTVQTTIIRTVRTRPPRRDRTERGPARRRGTPADRRQPDSRRDGGNRDGRGKSAPPERQQTTPAPDTTTTTPSRDAPSAPRDQQQSQQQQQDRQQQQSGGLEAGDG